MNKVHKEVVTKVKSPFSNSCRVTSKGLCGREEVLLTKVNTEVTCLDCKDKMEATK